MLHSVPRRLVASISPAPATSLAERIRATIAAPVSIHRRTTLCTHRDAIAQRQSANAKERATIDARQSTVFLASDAAFQADQLRLQALVADDVQLEAMRKVIDTALSENRIVAEGGRMYVQRTVTMPSSRGPSTWRVLEPLQPAASTRPLVVHTPAQRDLRRLTPSRAKSSATTRPPVRPVRPRSAAPVVKAVQHTQPNAPRAAAKSSAASEPATPVAPKRTANPMVEAMRLVNPRALRSGV